MIGNVYVSSYENREPSALLMACSVLEADLTSCLVLAAGSVYLRDGTTGRTGLRILEPLAVLWIAECLRSVDPSIGRLEVKRRPILPFHTHLGPGLALAASPLIPRMYGTGSANTGSGVHDAMLLPVLRCQLVEIVRRRCRVPGIYCPFVGICRYFVPGIV